MAAAPEASRKRISTGTPTPSGTRKRSKAPPRTLPAAFGRFTLTHHVGRGGMADIYLAQMPTAFGGERLVVIKEILPDFAGDARFAEMLVSEAKLAANLNHQNIVKTEDLGRVDDRLYIAMEYVEGLDLRELLRRCAKERVALPIEFSLHMVIQILQGLDYAHRFGKRSNPTGGVVHRDVSPSNILLSFEGEVKVCDFGIARANDLSEELPEETIQGKAGYMSPEHALGQPVDARADVFAVGIVLWEMLSGRKLYVAGSGASLLERARKAEIPALQSRSWPDEGSLFGIVEKALQKDPSARFPSAAAMRDSLEAYVAEAKLRKSPLELGRWLQHNFAPPSLPSHAAEGAAARAPRSSIPPEASAVRPRSTVRDAAHSARADADGRARPNPAVAAWPKICFALAFVALVVAIVSRL